MDLWESHQFLTIWLCVARKKNNEREGIFSTNPCCAFKQMNWLHRVQSLGHIIQWSVEQQIWWIVLLVECIGISLA